MPTIVSIQSIRHGTGQSNLIANLAVSIARQGWRVGVIDTDPMAPGIHTLFKLDEGHVDAILNYYLWGNVSLDEVERDLSPVLRIGPGEVVVMGGGIDLIPAQVKVKEVPDLLLHGYDGTVIKQAFLELMHRLNLDFLLIDLHPGITQEAMLLLAFTNTVLLVSGLDQYELQTMAVLVDLVRQLGVPKIFLIANQVLSGLDLNQVQRQLQAAYGESVLGVLPLTDELMALGSTGIFCQEYPHHPLTRTIQAIAQQLISAAERSSTPVD